MNYPGPYPQQPYPPVGPGRPPYPGHFPPPPRKKSNAGLILLIVVVAIIALCGVGGLLAHGSDRPAASARVTAAAGAAAPGGTGQPAVAPEARATAGPNTPVRDGKFEFTVTAVQSGVSTVGDNPFMRKTAQGAYTIVSLTVKNISNVPYGFSPSDQDLFDAQNRKFGNDAAAAMNLQANTSLYADINPGNAITAQVAFDLPADAAPDHIVLHDSMFSGGTTVSLR
ncbi:DUF4352 domain-containing protein [Nocardia sp. alder85J]|uniref:DUF4352 domain-containing protein n=1 Tax=Nocardia sp. alder85J TaxID=2862949 RepID=UPI001CD50BE7|nr:DUF4352 domain-containing protein [Nocardia sp. alder85J]MCX4098085.1 DUF4352 domain-containing protein [Nocardia sp. alder85J]